MEEHPDAKVIDALGGATAVGRIFRIRPQAVSAWRRAGIPDARRMYLELAHPDAFAADEVTSEPARDAA
jgi:hypothetical protein